MELDNDPDGFFLMVEDEDPDNGGHTNSRTTTIQGILSLRDSVNAVLAWANRRTETLILVFAERPGVNPTVTWASGLVDAECVGVPRTRTW